jgi:hypothetical protein
MDQNIDQDGGLEVIRTIELEDQAEKLRAEGKTFKQIGMSMGVSAHKARYLFLCAARRRGKPPQWTDGLNERLANSLHWLGFQSSDDVTAALKSGHLQTLARFERGLRGPAISELAQWLGLDDACSNSAEHESNDQRGGNVRKLASTNVRGRK